MSCHCSIRIVLKPKNEEGVRVITVCAEHMKDAMVEKAFRALEAAVRDATRDHERLREI